jgi:superfamily II DNA or RNA helicase
MARPTKSHGLYIQCVGRELRLAAGKKECLVLDFVDVSGKHSLRSAIWDHKLRVGYAHRHEPPLGGVPARGEGERGYRPFGATALRN